MKILSEKYPPTGFPNGWNCSKPSTDTIENNNNFLSSDLVAFVHSLVVLSPDFLDLTVLSNATILIGNLFAGVFVILNNDTNAFFIFVSLKKKFFF